MVSFSILLSLAVHPHVIRAAWLAIWQTNVQLLPGLTAFLVKFQIFLALSPVSLPYAFTTGFDEFA